MVAPILIVGQLFGNLPIIGITIKNCENLQFKWRSFRTIYAIVYLLLGRIEFFLAVFRGFMIGINIRFTGKYIYIYI